MFIVWLRVWVNAMRAFAAESILASSGGLQKNPMMTMLMVMVRGWCFRGLKRDFFEMV